jgi:rRNA maturation endonuclease Nob1
MTIEKAKNILATNKWHGQEKTTVEHNEALEIALAVLEMQIPKKALKELGWQENCPTCGFLAEEDYLYCRGCGQHLLRPWRNQI